MNWLVKGVLSLVLLLAMACKPSPSSQNEQTMSTTEISVQSCGEARTRICLTCDLKDDPALIAAYKKYHSREHHWDVIAEGIEKANVKMMDIYLVDNRMFMICEVPAGMDYEACMARMGTFDKMDEWAELMAIYQQGIPGHKLEWVKMERVFTMR